jgi:hypothetical protein
MQDDAPLAQAVEVRLKLVRDERELKRLTDDEKKTCKSWNSPANIPARTLSVVQDIRLTHCDRVMIEIVNRWTKPIDATLLYLASDGTIGLVGVSDPIPANHAHFADQFSFSIVTWCDVRAWNKCADLPTGYQSIGTEWLLVILAEAEGGRRTFEYLTQKGLDKAPIDQAVRGGDKFDSLLRNAALFPSETRGSVELAGDAAIKLFQWEVVPPGELGLHR